MNARATLRSALILTGGLLLCASAATPATPATYIVRPDGTGDFPTIQAAIDASVDGDTVELTDGTFLGDGNRCIDYLGKAIAVCSQSGDPSTCVIDCDHGCSGVLFENGETAASVLAGVSILHGICMQAPPACDGAGILCRDGASPTIRDCILSANLAEAGAGIFCDNASPTIDNCDFLYNAVSSWISAWDGSGICCRNGSAPLITNCRFVENQAVGVGGGIACTDSSPTITGCDFVSNYADGGGGIWSLRSSPNITDCRFVGNVSDARGSGIACVADGAGSLVATISNCVFMENDGFNGTGVSCSGSVVVISACTFVGQTAGYLISVVHAEFSAQVSIQNSIIAFNDGQAVRCGPGSSVTVRCSDLFDNTGGNWVGCIAGQFGINGNISDDPLFCDLQGGDLTIAEESPCAPGHSGGCGLIGALQVGCGVITAEPATWGAIKSSFR